jgi:hypothetical protein
LSRSSRKAQETVTAKKKPNKTHVLQVMQPPEWIMEQKKEKNHRGKSKKL